MNITIYHQHYFITITSMVIVITLYILQWIILQILQILCTLSCDSVQTFYIIIPTEAVWQPDQLHFDYARACLALQLQLMDPQVKGNTEA